MTRTEAILDVVGAHHKEPLARVVLQSIISDSGETDDGFVLRGTLASLAAWCGVPERTVRKRLDDLVEAKVIRRDGRRVEVLAAGLALWLDGEPAGAAGNRPERPETGTSGRITNRPERPETGRSGRKPAPAAGLKPSRVRGRDSLLGQDPNGSFPRGCVSEVVDHLAGERACEGRGLTPTPPEGPDPEIPEDEDAPPSLTPPVPAWEPEPIRPAAAAPAPRATGYGSGRPSPAQAYTPGPAPAPPVPPALNRAAMGTPGTLDRVLTPPPGVQPYEAPNLSPAQHALFLAVVKDLEKALGQVSLSLSWESAARGVASTYPAAVVTEAVVGLVAYIEATPGCRPRSTWLTERARKAAAVAERGETTPAPAYRGGRGAPRRSMWADDRPSDDVHEANFRRLQAAAEAQAQAQAQAAPVATDGRGGDAW